VIKIEILIMVCSYFILRVLGWDIYIMNEWFMVFKRGKLKLLSLVSMKPASASVTPATNLSFLLLTPAVNLPLVCR